MLTFQTDILIRGKKADKYQELKTRFSFDLVDIFMISGVLGFIHKKKDIQQNDGNTIANLPRNVLQNRSEKIDFLCEIISLSEEIDLDPDKAIRIAFEDSSIDKPKKLYKLDLFSEYALGGIDILYEMLSISEYDEAVDNLKSIMDKFLLDEKIGKKTTEEIFDEEGL